MSPHRRIASPQPAATWPRPRSTPAWSTGSATAPRSANGIAAIVGDGDDGVPGSYKHIDYDDWVGRNPLGESGGAIGVVTVAGEIVDGEAGLGTAGAETIAAAITKGLRDKDLKALVVRVDSPGRLGAWRPSGSARRCSTPRRPGCRW